MNENTETWFACRSAEKSPEIQDPTGSLVAECRIDVYILRPVFSPSQ